MTKVIIFVILAVLALGIGIGFLTRAFGRQTYSDGALVPAKALKKRRIIGVIASVLGAIFIVLAILFNTVWANSTPKTGDDESASGPKASATPSGEVNLDDAALPKVNLTEAELDAMFSDYDKYFMRSSMPSMASFKVLMTEITPSGKISTKRGFSDAVAIPMWADQQWFDEGMGYVRGTETAGNSLSVSDMNVGPKASLSSNVRDALKKQATSWMKDFRKDLKNAEDKDDMQLIMRRKVYNQILRNPVFGDMMVQWLANEPLATRNNGDWLLQFKKDLDAAYKTDEGICKFIQYDPAHLGSDKDAWMRVTDDYWYNACRVCALMENFVGIGLKDNLKSKENWHLPMQADANMMRTEKADCQEKRESFVLTYQDKKTKKIVLKIGFNVEDMRLEIFPLKVKIVTPTTPPTGTKPPTATNPPSKVTPPSNVTPPNKAKGSLVVKYVYANGPKKGQQAAKTQTRKGYVGQVKSVSSPTIAGYTATKTLVSVKLKKGKTTRVVKYYKQGKTPTYSLTIKYVFEDGSPAAPYYNKTGLKQGDKYSKTSPTLSGYTANRKTVSGTMPAHDVVETVKYTRNATTTTPTPKPATPTAKPKPSKDPMADPVQNSNAPTGGGDNKPGNGDGDPQPTAKPASPTMTPKPTNKPVESNDENGTVHGGNPPATGNITDNAKPGTDSDGNKIPISPSNPAGKLDSDGF